MRCQICNRETDNFYKDKDGQYVSICNTCKSAVRDSTRLYGDLPFDEDDEKLLNTPSLKLLQLIDRECRVCKKN